VNGGVVLVSDDRGASRNTFRLPCHSSLTCSPLSRRASMYRAAFRMLIRNRDARSYTEAATPDSSRLRTSMRRSPGPWRLSPRRPGLRFTVLPIPLGAHHRKEHVGRSPMDDSLADGKSNGVGAAGALAALHVHAARLSEEAAILTCRRSALGWQTLPDPAGSARRAASLAETSALRAVEHAVDGAHDASESRRVAEIQPATVLGLGPARLALRTGVIRATRADARAPAVVIAAVVVAQFACLARARLASADLV
jgi:hypothetical protein